METIALAVESNTKFVYGKFTTDFILVDGKR